MGGFRGSEIEKWVKSAKRLDRLAPIWHTYADSSGNEHGLKNNYPLETPGGILRGLCAYSSTKGSRPISGGGGGWGSVGG